ncbi:hypothetical protein AB0L53_45210 [Nonomuraea sp. NPDC052129]|uniref:hypothetical protein n=1 Tax=Nonomuraea sp. NPDC052129 TaxID=3154651 RepID=UPI00343E7A25
MRRTGRLIVERSLAAGHRVTAIARRPQALQVAGPGLTIRTAGWSCRPGCGCRTRSPPLMAGRFIGG